MRTKAAAAALIAAVGLLSLWLALGTGQARSASACTAVNGHLLDEHVEGGITVGRMVGGINGRYEFTLGPLVGVDPDGGVIFGTGDAKITTNDGELRWHETSAFDPAREDDYNDAVLATVRGGTGDWAGASGHVIMSGFFHISTLTGEFDYRGEVCRS
jgi:hypothetical protein